MNCNKVTAVPITVDCDHDLWTFDFWHWNTSWHGQPL